MKRLFFSLSFLAAISFAFAFKAMPVTSNAFYRPDLSHCNPGNTNESGCSTSGGGVQCTVTDGTTTAAAWSQNDCTIALKLP